MTALWALLLPFLSTLSLRRATLSLYIIRREVLFLSTLSLRRATRSLPKYSWQWKFLSTLSLRRATAYKAEHKMSRNISIHALLAESDRNLHN